MDLGNVGVAVAVNEMIKLLAKIKNKYWKLGKTVATTTLPDEVKSQFYSLGNDLDKFISIAKTLDDTQTSKRNP